MAWGHTMCNSNKQQKASNMMGSQINIFLSSVSTTFGTEGVDRITTETNALEDDKEYQVCATLKMRIDDAVAQSPRKSRRLNPEASTATINMNTTTRLTAVFKVDDGLEEYVVFDDAAAADSDAIEVEKQKKQRMGHRTKFPTDILNRNKKYNKPLKQLCWRRRIARTDNIVKDVLACCVDGNELDQFGMSYLEGNTELAKDVLLLLDLLKMNIQKEMKVDYFT